MCASAHTREYIIIKFENIWSKSEECDGTSITRRSNLDAGERKFFFYRVP